MSEATPCLHCAGYGSSLFDISDDACAVCGGSGVKKGTVEYLHVDFDAGTYGFTTDDPRGVFEPKPLSDGSPEGPHVIKEAAFFLKNMKALGPAFKVPCSISIVLATYGDDAQMESDLAPGKSWLKQLGFAMAESSLDRIDRKVISVYKP